MVTVFFVDECLHGLAQGLDFPAQCLDTILWMHLFRGFWSGGRGGGAEGVSEVFEFLGEVVEAGGAQMPH